jgi:Na+/glutamate symporter
MLEQSFMPFFGTFGWISIMLLIGVVLRAKVGLLPALLLSAGIIALCLILLKVFNFWGKPNWN